MKYTSILQYLSEIFNGTMPKKSAYEIAEFYGVSEPFVRRLSTSLTAVRQKDANWILTHKDANEYALVIREAIRFQNYEYDEFIELMMNQMRKNMPKQQDTKNQPQTTEMTIPTITKDDLYKFCNSIVLEMHKNK